MSDVPAKAVVNVEINGEQYAIRTGASPEYTRECAAHLDKTISEIVEKGVVVEGHRAVILAALALTDQCFRLRSELAEVRSEAERRAGQLAMTIENTLG